MKLYNYNKKTGKYLNSTDIEIRNGIEIIPAFSTKNKPLEKKDGFDVVYKNNQWIYKKIPDPVKFTYKEKREQKYKKVIPIGDQLDAILKAFDVVLQQDSELPLELIDIIDKWQSIKEEYPKS